MVLVACALIPAGWAEGRSDSSHDRVFYVNMLDRYAQRYTIGRYTDGRPDPFGSVLFGEIDETRSCPGLVWPSVTRDRDGTYFLYVSERRCGEQLYTRVSLYTSENGYDFVPQGPVFEAQPGETQLGTSYVVFDRDRFRAWVTVSPEGDPDGSLLYAESKDGIHFERIGSEKQRGMQLDFVFRHRGRWRLLYTDRSWVPRMMAFDNPRQSHYRDVGPIGDNRNIKTQLVSGAVAGDDVLQVAGTDRFHPRDLIVVAHPGGQADVVRLRAVKENALVLSRGLHRDHPAGDTVAVSDARKIIPGYVCRRKGGGWGGVFTTWEAVPRILYEQTTAFKAASLRGPWRVDRAARAPVLSLRNIEYKRSVENPAPVTRDPSVERCK